MKMTKTDYPRTGETLYSCELENGLRIFVVPKPGFSSKYAVFSTNYGGNNRRFEIDGRILDTPAGVAHFLEHKMFDMPDGTDALQYFAEKGADANAFTSPSGTSYLFECTDGFEANLRTLLSFVSTPYYTEASVAKEQGIIGQEIQGCLDRPGYALYKDLLGLLYERHPIKDLVVGTVESIAQITPEILYDCHKKFYAPSNMILCVVGDVDPQTVADIAEEVLPAGRAEIPKADFGEPEGLLPVKNRSERRMEVSLPQFLLGAKVPYVKSREERIAAQMSLRLMFGRSSAFYNRLYAAKLINRDFDYETDYLSETAMVNIGGESSSPEAAADEILKELERVTREGLNADDFRRVKRASIGGHLRILEDFDTLGDYIVYNAFEGLDYLDYLDVLDRVTIEDCEKYVRENLQPERFALALLFPGKETEC